MIERADSAIINVMNRIALPAARIAIFVVFFWFGALKVFGLSPASPLVASLLERTLPFMTFNVFIVWFGIFEMVIGLTFLFPGLERLAIALLFPHMAMTAMPLFLLPQITWSGWFVPTLEGQYIIKNLAIVALVLSLAARLHPFKKRAIL